MEHIGFLIGQFIGALSISGIITRIAFISGKRTRKAAFVAAGIGFVFAVLITCVTPAATEGGQADIAALILYVISLALWLTIDLKRAAKQAAPVIDTDSPSA